MVMEKNKRIYGLVEAQERIRVPTAFLVLPNLQLDRNTVHVFYFLTSS